MAPQGNDGSSLKRAEFWLVIALLLGLGVVIALIFWVTWGTDEKLLEHRKDLIAIMLGAFGAWIGAGAAYFFGRENMREATSSMLQMRGISPQERLTRTTLRDLKPKPLPSTFKNQAKIEEVLTWIEVDPERFFATILDERGHVVSVVAEEALYRFLRDRAAQGEGYDQVKGRPIADAIAYVEKELKEKHKENPVAVRALHNLVDAAVRLREDQPCSLANQMMEQQRKFVTLVLDTNDMPVGYITDADIRRLVLSW